MNANEANTSRITGTSCNDRNTLGELELLILRTDTNPDYDAINLSDAIITEVD